MGWWSGGVEVHKFAREGASSMIVQWTTGALVKKDSLRKIPQG
jgi:hypothetical protein